jgi:hypothetical protein
MKNLEAKEFAALLIKLDACIEARKWAKGKSLAEVWSTCHRGDWMLWLLGRYGDFPHKVIVAISCDCAEPALVFTGDPRPAECIAVVRRWLKDEATISDVRAAAYAAGASTYAAGASTYAAYAAGASGAAYAESLQFSADISRKYISVEDNHDQNCH